MPVFGSNETISFLSLSSDRVVRPTWQYRKVTELFPNTNSFEEPGTWTDAPLPIYVQLLLPVVKVEPAL